MNVGEGELTDTDLAAKVLRRSVVCAAATSCTSCMESLLPRDKLTRHAGVITFLFHDIVSMWAIGGTDASA